MTDNERAAAGIYMEEALKLAEEAASRGEVPVGAVIVKEGKIIGRGSNRTIAEKDPTAHAEMQAIHAALKASGGWRLPGCDMYVTLEPCAMCAGAIVHARIDNLYIGTPDPKSGACGSVLDVTGEPKLNHHPAVHTGIMQDECAQLLRRFFRELRRK
ncbi:MAG: tRNA adenosine(34) deaminase TadA [Anaerovoracaceae bacterium]|jgi:tRNA(adenine34) deaminase